MNYYNKTAIKNIDSNTYWHSNGIYLQSWNIWVAKHVVLWFLSF